MKAKMPVKKMPMKPMMPDMHKEMHGNGVNPKAKVKKKSVY